MPQISPLVIAGIGLAVSAVGTGVGVYYQHQAAEASKKAERLRKRQMDLDAARNRRKNARDAMIARSAAVSNASAQGGMGGTGLAGGLAQVTGREGATDVNITQSQEIGTGIFKANADYASAQAGASFGEGLNSLGGGIFNSSDKIFSVGASYGLWSSKNS